MNWDVVRHQVAIAGRVSDAATGKALAGAVLTIISMPAAFRRTVELLSRQRSGTARQSVAMTRSRSDGIFYFLDLPEGKYTITATLPAMRNRYGGAEQTANVARDTKGNMKLASMNFDLQPTLIKGKITGTGHKAGLAMAEVRIRGSGERAFTDAQGEYMLAGIEPGKRNVLVSAQGYRVQAQAIVLANPGDTETLNFNLAREAG